jgi:hypothetical protein
MLSGSETSFTSTAVTLTPHGSVWRSMISWSFRLIDVALRKQVVQRGLADDAAEGGLRDERGRLPEVLDLDHGGNRVHDAEIDDRIDGGGHVVAGHHLLLRDVNGDHAQVHLDHAVHDRDEDNEARPFGAEQFAKPENDAALVFAQDADGLRQDNRRQDDDRHGPGG